MVYKLFGWDLNFVPSGVSCGPQFSTFTSFATCCPWLSPGSLVEGAFSLQAEITKIEAAIVSIYK
jgi:hypothetical protein